MASSQVYKLCKQNFQGLLYLHFYTTYGFERYDIFVGKINGFNTYWSVEPDYTKYNKLLRVTPTGLQDLQDDGSWLPTRAKTYEGLLERMHTSCDTLSDFTFYHFAKFIKYAHPDYRAHLERVILTPSFV